MPRGKQPKIGQFLKRTKRSVSGDSPENSNKSQSNPSKKPKLSDKNPKVEPLNRVHTDYTTFNLDCCKKSPEGKCWNFKIASWNIVSLKALVKKNGMEYLVQESPDVMCMQETKCGEKQVPAEAKIPGYHRYFNSGEKEGYAGIALYSKKEPINVEFGIGQKEFDNEGRVITAEYEEFYIVNAYVPNAGRGLVTLPKRMKWDPLFRTFLKKLDDVKPVILCGDLNVAHNEIDLKNPDKNTRTAGFTEEERNGFTSLLQLGFVDTFRHLYPELTGAYTYWNYIGNARSRNAGWRLDYFVVSKRLTNAVCDNVIRNQVYGSDHCPIALFLSL